jgi:alpha/beta hydrolase fold
VSQQQRDALDQLLRAAPLDLGGDVAEQRVIFEEMMAAIPVPADVTTSSGSLGGIPVINVEVAGADPERVIIYLHGGAYAIGTAASSVGLASDLARRAGTRLVTVDYRLAPEHPHPAAIDDVVAAYRGLLDSGMSPSAIAVAGESAGAGLAAAALVALKHTGMPQPDSGRSDVALGRPDAVRGQHHRQGRDRPGAHSRRSRSALACKQERRLTRPLFGEAEAIGVAKTATGLEREQRCRARHSGGV